MLCVFLFRVFYNFPRRGGEVSIARPSTSSPQKFVSADDKSKHKHAQPFITRTNLLTRALYMSHSGGSFGYRGIAVTAIHAVCVFVLGCLTFCRGEKKRSLYCSSSDHQKSVSADDKSKHNKPSPLSPEPTSWLGLCTRVTAAAALAIAASHSPPYILCAFLLYNFPWREAAQLICLAALRFS